MCVCVWSVGCGDVDGVWWGGWVGGWVDGWAGGGGGGGVCVRERESVCAWGVWSVCVCVWRGRVHKYQKKSGIYPSVIWCFGSVLGERM